MDEIQSLKIITIFEIFAVSLIGYFLPIMFTRRKLDVEAAISSNWFRNLKALSTGVIIGVATLHLLNDALTDIDTTEVNGYPSKLFLFMYRENLSNNVYYFLFF